jgi:hypothetical protein
MADTDEIVDSWYNDEFKGVYTPRKELEPELKQDKYNKADTIKFIKAYRDAHKIDMKQREAVIKKDVTNRNDLLHTDNALYPYYGSVNRESDVADIGTQIGRDSNSKVGVSVLGLPPNAKHKDLYTAIMNMTHDPATVFGEIETTPDAVDEYSDKTQLEDLDPYSGPDQPMTPAMYDMTDIVRRDLNRDNDYEFHINKGTIKNIAEGLNADNLARLKDYAEEIASAIRDIGFENKKQVVSTLRSQYKLSPFVINEILSVPFGYMNRMGQADRIKNTLFKDKYVRPYADRMIKQRHLWSDAKLKHIKDSVKGVI